MKHWCSQSYAKTQVEVFYEVLKLQPAFAGNYMYVPAGHDIQLKKSVFWDNPIENEWNDEVEKIVLLLSLS